MTVGASVDDRARARDACRVRGRSSSALRPLSAAPPTAATCLTTRSSSVATRICRLEVAADVVENARQLTNHEFGRRQAEEVRLSRVEAALGALDVGAVAKHLSPAGLSRRFCVVEMMGD